MSSIFFIMKCLVDTCWSVTAQICPVTVCSRRIKENNWTSKAENFEFATYSFPHVHIFFCMKNFVTTCWSVTARFCPVTACSRRIKITNEHQQSKDENLDSATYHFSILHPPSAEVSSYPFFFAWRISLTLRAPTSICFSGSKLLRVCGTVLRV